jgi:hypothetical protein
MVQPLQGPPAIWCAQRREDEGGVIAGGSPITTEGRVGESAEDLEVDFAGDVDVLYPIEVG